MAKSGVPRSASESRTPATALPGLLLRLDAELPLERGCAAPVLQQRRGPLPLARIQRHQPAQRAFAQRFEPQELLRGLDRALRRSGGGLLVGEIVEGDDHELAQPRSLTVRPVVERRLVENEPVEEGTGVTRGHALEGRRRRRRRATLERVDVDTDPRRVEGDRRARRDQRGPSRGRERLAQQKESLAQAGLGLRLPRLAPEEALDLLAQMALPWPEGQVREQGLGLSRRDRELGRPEADPELPEKEDLQALPWEPMARASRFLVGLLRGRGAAGSGRHGSGTRMLPFRLPFGLFSQGAPQRGVTGPDGASRGRTAVRQMRFPGETLQGI
jgi:hypothetical protein